jgi:hypothetical protein
MTLPSLPHAHGYEPFIAAQPLRKPRIGRDKHPHQPTGSVMKHLFPVVFALIPLAAVIGACVTCH